MFDFMLFVQSCLVKEEGEGKIFHIYAGRLGRKRV